MQTDSQENTETIYVQDGGKGCEIFAMPYRLPLGQLPSAIHPMYQITWTKVAELDEAGVLRSVHPNYRLHLQKEYLIPGMYFEVSRPESLRLRPAAGFSL